MNVKLKYGWFAPGNSRLSDKRPMSGTFYARGLHVMSDDMRDLLPSSAKILDDVTQEYMTPKEMSLRDYDMDRAAAEEEAKIHENMSKARAALAEKRSQKAAAKRAGEVE